MRVSFKVSKQGARFRPKPKPHTQTLTANENEDVDEINNTKLSAVDGSKPKVNDVTEGGEDDNAVISDADISFFINLFPDGYSIGNPSESRAGLQAAVQDDPKFLHPYDRTSESLFLAIERGLLPADFLDDIPCKYIKGAVACEVRDYRNCGSDPGVNNGSSADAPTPITTKIRLKMSLENVVKDIPSISDSSWTYGDLMEAEARILMALQPKLNLDPTPNFDRLCKTPTPSKLNLNIRDLRRKRLRLMSGSDHPVQGKKVCMENSNSGPIVQQSDLVNMTTQNVGPGNMVSSVPASPSLSYQSKYQMGAGNSRVMQDHGSDMMMNAYGDAKRENQDGQLSPMTNLSKRARTNSMGLDGVQQQQPQQQMDGFNTPESQWKNSLLQQQQQQSMVRGGQLANAAGVQKYPFDGSFNQEQFTMGQSGMRYNLKQEPDTELNRNMHMVDSDVDPRLQQQQRMTQQFARSSFPPTPWNNLDNSRKEEQFQRRKSAQSPRVSGGALPQSPLSSKSGEFSSGSMGGQYGVGAMGSSQRDKSAVTSVPTVGGAGAGSMTSSAQMAARRTTSLPKTPAMSGVGSPASVGNMSGPFNATSPHVGKETDKSMREKFSKIEMLTVKYQLNNKRNKVDEYKNTTSFPTRELNNFLFNDQNNEIPKDETCKMPLSKSLVGGSMNVCKTRVLHFMQSERVLQGNGFSLVPKSRTRMILSEKRDDGTVAMHYGEHDECDYLAAEELLPTLPNTHVADLLAAQFCTLILREGYRVEGDHLQPKPINPLRSSGDQPNNNNASGILSPNSDIPEAVSGQPSNEVAKPSDSGTNNTSMMTSQNMPLAGARMHPPANMQIPQGGVSMPASRPMQSESQPSFQQQNQHNLMGLGNVGMGGITGNNMVGMQGMGNVMGMGGNRGISPPMAGAISGMGNSMGQNPINMNQALSISNVISQQLRSGMITPAQAAIMTTKLRMAQSRNILGGASGQAGNITGLAGASRQETTSPLQAVLSPPQQQVGSLSMGRPQQQQASPQQMSQRTPMSPQLSSGAIHPPMSSGNQDGACPPSPQLSSHALLCVSLVACFSCLFFVFGCFVFVALL